MALSILVCIKAVPVFSEKSAFAPEGGWIAGEGLDWQMNPYDAQALEMALTLKDDFPEARVDALSMGGEHARSVIRRAMAMGADHGIHLHCGSESPLQPESIALAIASHAVEKNYDLIFTGAISVDAMNGLTGPMIASALNLPCSAGATHLDFNLEEKSLVLSCELEGGLSEKVRLFCPALVTMQTGSRAPRYPSLSNTLRTRKQPLEEIPVSPDQENFGAIPLECFFPAQTSACQILTGTAAEKADALLAIFHGNGWLK